MQPVLPPSSAQRPLVVRLCNMVGDVVLGLPALRLLEQHGWQLHLYGKGWAPGLLAGEGWACTKRVGKFGARTQQLRDIADHCRSIDPQFDQRTNALIMPNSFSSAFEARWAGLKPAGYARDGRSLLLRQAWQPDPPAHALEGFWGLACRLTGHQGPPPSDINLRVHERDHTEADALLAEHGIQPGFICIVPYAAGDVDGQDKRWPEFAAFTRALAKASSATIVTCPGPGEESIARDLHPDAKCLPNLALGPYLGLLKRAGLVISNDTGPAHMAAAVGTPVVSVLGPTKPWQWRPWGSNVRIVKGSTSLWPSVDEVLAEALK